MKQKFTKIDGKSQKFMRIYGYPLIESHADHGGGWSSIAPQ